MCVLPADADNNCSRPYVRFVLAELDSCSAASHSRGVAVTAFRQIESLAVASARLASASQPAHGENSADGTVKKRIGYGSAQGRAGSHANNDIGPSTTGRTACFGRRRCQQEDCDRCRASKCEQSLAHGRPPRIAVEPTIPRRPPVPEQISLPNLNNSGRSCGHQQAFYRMAAPELGSTCLRIRLISVLESGVFQLACASCRRR